MHIRLLDKTTRARARDGDYEELGYNLHANDLSLESSAIGLALRGVATGCKSD
jgi:hypothetical protein